MAKIENIPDTDHIIRHAKNKHLSWKLNDSGEPEEIIACYHDLFKLRNDPEFVKRCGAPEKNLSVNWIEFFQGNDEERLQKTVADFLGTLRKLKKSEAFAKLNVGELKQVCQTHESKIRAIHDAEGSSIKSHASITQLPQDNSILFEDLCNLAFKTLLPAKKFINP